MEISTHHIRRQFSLHHRNINQPQLSSTTLLCQTLNPTQKQTDRYVRPPQRKAVRQTHQPTSLNTNFNPTNQRPNHSVRREELLSRTSTSPSPSPPPESSLTDVHQRLGALLDIDALLAPQPDPSPQPTTEANPDEDEEQEFEFRLFSAPAKSESKKEEQAAVESSTTQAQKLRIRVRSPTPGAVGVEDGRFVNPFRGWGYYFSAPGAMAGVKEDELRLEEERLREKRRQFEDVAVSGLQVVGFAGVEWVSLLFFLLS